MVQRRATETPEWLGASKLLIFTDETDESYLASLVASIEGAFPSKSGGSVRHADRAAAAHTWDDFFTFAVASKVIAESSLQFGMRRCDGTVDCHAHLGQPSGGFLSVLHGDPW